MTSPAAMRFTTVSSSLRITGVVAMVSVGWFGSKKGDDDTDFVVVLTITSLPSWLTVYVR